MKIRYYSQSGEDALLWSVFPNREQGFYVEVGAFDGRHLSNTLSFEEQGWSGICVEPHPDYFAACRANRPNATCINAACVAPGSPSTVTFLSEPLGLLSGVRADETPNMPGRYASRGMTFPGFASLQVPARTLDSILAEHHPSVREVDFLSVDVEGTEVDVLSGFSLDAKVIVAEANTPETLKALEDYMSRRGYHRGREIDPNYFYARDRETAEKLASASFDVVTEHTQHPMGVAATHPSHTGRRICLG